MKHAQLPAFDVSRETIEKLRIYERLVSQWTTKINLVARADMPAFWERHVVDCLQIVPLIPGSATCLTDLGSGAGLPGFVLAVAGGVKVTMIEADHRKAAFLRAASIALDVPATILTERIETAHPPAAPVVTARALAPLPELLSLAVPKLAQRGTCLFMKGKNVESELTLAGKQWQMNVERFVSRTSPEATILRLSEITRAESSFVKSTDV